MKPSGRLAKQNWMGTDETLRVMEALNKDGGEARFVGGCVRDALANREIYDIDIATPLTPDEVIRKLDAAGIRHVPTGIKHGTVTALIDGHPFEITTLRIDVKTHGRHADVEFTDNWREDAARRDFTMNAMFCDLEGNIYDAFGGIEDLRCGRIRFVGDPHKRIEEDVLRILRFFRFHAHYGRGQADPVALAACASHAENLKKLSVERVSKELLKTLESDHAAIVWQMMMKTGVMAIVLPQATNVERLTRLINLEEKFFCKTDAIRRLAALIGGDAAFCEEVPVALKLSNDDANRLEVFTQRTEIVLEANIQALHRAVYMLGNDAIRSLLLLGAAQEKFPNDRVAEFYHEATSWRAPRFPLTGEDVMKQGVAAGPEIGKALKTVEDWWAQNDFTPGRTECLERLNKP